MKKLSNSNLRMRQPESITLHYRYGCIAPWHTLYLRKSKEDLTAMDLTAI